VRIGNGDREGNGVRKGDRITIDGSGIENRLLDTGGDVGQANGDTTGTIGFFGQRIKLIRALPTDLFVVISEVGVGIEGLDGVNKTLGFLALLNLIGGGTGGHAGGAIDTIGI